MKNEYEIKSHKSFYEDEFKEETRALINVFSSFERNAMQRLDEVEKKKIFHRYRQAVQPGQAAAFLVRMRSTSLARS